jgi:site-specific DNA recombinase
MRPKRCVGYARVSSAEQAVGSSLADQQVAIRAYAKSKGFEVDRMYVEAESAVHERIEQRVQVQALMRDVRAGDLVLVDKLDRWSRDPEFTYRSVREILAAGAGFYSVSESCDPSTPEGDSALGFRILFAREEHKRIKQRMVGTRQLLRDRGYFADGLVPWGYRRQGGKGAEKNVLVIVPDLVDGVRQVFRLCAAGQSFEEIAATMGLTRFRVRSVLRSRMYLGEVRDGKGNWIRGRHEPVVDPATWAEAHAAIASRRQGRARRAPLDAETASWWTRDVARCALCGAKMSSAWAGPRDARRYYYHCTARTKRAVRRTGAERCAARYVRVDATEQACDALVLARLTELRAELAKPPKEPSGPRVVDVEEQRSRLAAKRARTVDAFTEGMIPHPEFRERIARLDEERTKLDALAAERPKATLSARRETLRSLAALTRAWKIAGPPIRRSIVARLATRLEIAAGKAPQFVWRSADDLARLGNG